MSSVGWQPWRPSGRRRKPAIVPAFVSIVDPSPTRLRLLVVELGDEHSTVWGWTEQETGIAGRALNARPLTQSLDAMLARAEATAHEKAERLVVTDQLLVGLPASQLRGWAWPVAQRRPQADRPVEERELETLLGRALRLAVNRLKEPEERGWVLVEAVPVALTVDGRRVTNPVGFRAGEIGATVFAALAAADTVDAWRQVAEELRFATLTLAATPVALAAGLAQTELQGLVVDVGEATTDLTWWRAGRPIGIDSLPMGGAQLTYLMQQRWGLETAKAETLKRAYTAGRLTAEAGTQVLEVIAPAVRAWLELTESALAEMNAKADEALPHRLYLCGGGGLVPEVAEAARSLVWSERLRFDRHPQLDLLQATDVPGVVNRTDSGRGGGDVSALALAAWARSQQGALDQPSSILRKLCEA